MDQTADLPTSGTSVAQTLREARLAKGLELSEVSEMTHVRKDYLEAIEEGRFEALPEPIYARNFLKLFASAVGLDGAAMVARYQSEAGEYSQGKAAVAASTSSSHSGETPTFKETRRFTVGAWLPTFLLIAAVVGGALWLFNTYLFNPAENTRVAGNAGTVQTDSSPEPLQSETVQADAAQTNAAQTNATQTDAAQTAGAATVTDTQANATTAPASAATVTPSNPAGDVLFSLTTEPPGAEVSIDNYVLPGTTPIVNAPISAGAERILSVTLDGFDPVVESIDLTEDQQLSLDLAGSQATELIVGDETNGGADPATDDAVDTGNETENAATTDTAEAPAPVATPGEGVLVITLSADTWVEAYSSDTRGEGERLVYQTLTAGESRAFELPVYVHVGNAGGVALNLNGSDAGTLGSSGEVLGRAFTE